MFIWVIIIISVLFGFIGYKKGFYVMFATLFNLMFATFVSVLSTPKLLSLSSGYENSGYYGGASMLLMFLLIFGVLQFFAYLYFLRNSEGLFPKLFDKIGAILLGCLAGYIISSVLLLTFCVMPCSAKAAELHFCRRDQLQSLSVPGVRKVCNFLAWYSLHCFEDNSDRVLERLLSLGEQTTDSDDETVEEENLVPDVLSGTP